ncbi:alpha/beta hydrolase-fold protein [Streptococcus gordonii]|mgnify:FL=1|uniref:alpha/beta hydrolase-fold protein n=1 Tax=Streptococcus gordonii TaxID=1302 RepID=UPI0022E30FDD|nr:alpha/beta hydrolase-fold protein [Streptococcus gordonii]
MTLSINKTFVWEGITVNIALPKDYDGSKSYPAVLLNDGQINYLSSLSSSVILIGLISNNRLEDYTPWKANTLKPGNPDFGGKADSYHQKLFTGILTEIRRHYLLDEKRIAYGGYSLGGLAAVYSLYSDCKIPCIFSICGSFWYPGFTDYCRTQDLKNRDCLVYLQNGKTEGANHSNRLSKAPFYAEEIHRLIQKEILTTCSIFDPYGHHEALQSRYDSFIKWLVQYWHLETTS